MEVHASVKHVRISPRKLRLVVDQVRGKSAAEARQALELIRKNGSQPVLKLLNSAVANATHNYKLAEENLVIKTIQVDEGFTIKRYRPRAFGRAAMVRKRTSSIKITLEDRAPKTAKPKTAKPAATAKAETVAEEKPATSAKAKKEEKKPASKKTSTKKSTAKKNA